MKKIFNGVVYITTNTINGHKYIGKDANNRPNYLGSGKALRKAVVKYGKENFIKEILAYAQNLEDLVELESYYIDYYGAQKSSIFYNIAPGGEGGDRGWRRQGKKVNQYNLNGVLIKVWESISEAAKYFGVVYNSIFQACQNGGKCRDYLWRHHGYEGIVKEIEYPDKRDFCVFQYDSDGKEIGKFKSVLEASKETGIPNSSIIKMIDGGVMSYECTFISTLKKKIVKNTFQKDIYQYDLDSNLISIHSYPYSNILHYGIYNIIGCIKGHRKTSSGYKWSDKEL